MGGTRIYWTTGEIHRVVNRFFELYCNDPFAPILALLNRAQKDALPSERQRVCKAISAYGKELCRELGAKKIEVKQRLQGKTPPTPLPPPAPTPKPEDVEPLIIQLSADEKPVDKKKVLDEMSTGELVGVIVDRMGPSLGAILAALTASRASGPLPLHIVQDPLPTARVPREDTSAKFTAAVKRVTVVGLFPESERFVREKIANFGNITVTFVDSNAKNVSSKVADYVILMRRIVSHSQREQAVSIHGRDRIIYVEGGQNELLKKLADLNSTPAKLAS
jgi:hypothetical protein